MRLIDADALLKSYDIAWMYEYDETGCGVRRKAIPIKCVEEAPTIEAEPVRRGRWVVVEPDGWNCRGYNVTPKIKCSVCERAPKEHKTEDYGQGGTIVSYSWDRTTYCPHCGAKMDAKEESGK